MARGIFRAASLVSNGVHFCILTQFSVPMCLPGAQGKSVKVFPASARRSIVLGKISSSLSVVK